MSILKEEQETKQSFNMCLFSVSNAFAKHCLLFQIISIFRGTDRKVGKEGQKDQSIGQISE